MLKLILISLALVCTSAFGITKQEQEIHCNGFADRVKIGFTTKKENPGLTEEMFINSAGELLKSWVDTGKITKQEGAVLYVEYKENIQFAYTFDSSEEPQKVRDNTYKMCVNMLKPKASKQMI